MTDLRVVDDIDPDDDDFLKFWAEHRSRQTRPTKRILGVDVTVPYEIPLNFAARFEAAKDSEDPEDSKELLAILFGAGVLDQWIARGVTTQMLKVLTAWATANATGSPVDFADAVALADRAEAEQAAREAEGKAPAVPNRADRRASSKTAASGGTGRSSKRTSNASTASTKKPSRRSASAAS